jgi:methionyl aminopeptidase
MPLFSDRPFLNGRKKGLDGYNCPMIERNDPCYCGSGKKWKKCCYPKVPEMTQTSELAAHYWKTYKIILKTPEQLVHIRRACQITRDILNELCRSAKAGVTTLELDILSRKLHAEAGAVPAPLNYGNPPYPMSICTSLNDVICHGIPDKRPLQEGDILNIDASAKILVDGNWYFGDCSAMVTVGRTPPDRQLVTDVSEECLKRAIEVCKPGEPLLSIGKAIEDYASEKGCSVVNQFVGHGIGIHFHEPPEIFHHYNKSQIPMAPGMTFTIEPMINAGVREGELDPTDGWTVRTKDRKPSAQWEHTILITENGHEILTENN